MKRQILTIILILVSLNLSAQKVGLVLSGGGAKGLYHVGMLKALEENGIPIDYVSGASMGAIVGALYASGYSPDEMLQFFATDSVRTWLSGKIPDEYRYYFKKFAPTPQLVSIKINPDTVKLTNVLELPTNVISPYRIDLAFINMLTPSSSAAGNNFDSLMVPFRCLASDVYNKKSVVMKSGDLAFAVRASMTIPLAFKPIKRDSLLLYDGGIYNNFPWQALEEDFKPDIYIGGVCAGNYDNPSQNDIVSQLSVMITQNTDYSLPKPSDIIIKRRFPEINTLDYERAAYIMACGYEDAMRQMPEILKTIKRRVSQEEIAAKRWAFKAKIQPLIYDKIEVKGLDKDQTEYVNRQLDIRGDYQITASERFEDKYMRTVATEVFTGEFPNVVYDPETGYHKLKVKMHTQPSMRFSLGGNISSSSLNLLYLGLNYQQVKQTVSNYGINAYLGTFYNAVDIGGRHDMFTRFPFYIDYYLGYEKFSYDNNNSAAYYKNQAWRSITHADYYFGGSLAVPFLDNSAFRARLVFGRMSDRYFQDYHTSIDISCKSEYTYGSLAAEMQSQSFNYQLYPTHGANQLVRFKLFVGAEDYTRGSIPLLATQDIRSRNRSWVEARYMREHYIPINKWLTLGYLADLTLSNHPEFANDVASAITQPAFEPTPLSKTLFMREYRSPSYLAAGIVPVINFNKSKNFYLKSYLYGFLPQKYVYDNGWQDITAERLTDHYHLIFGGSIVYQSIIGPASFTVTKFTTGPSNWNFSLNIGFVLFSTHKQ